MKTVYAKYHLNFEHYIISPLIYKHGTVQFRADLHNVLQTSTNKHSILITY